MTGNRKIIDVPVAAPVILAGLFILGLTGCEESDEEGHTEQRVAIEQVPAAVRATLEQERKSGTLKEIEKITAEGKTVYAADMVVNGKDQETLIAEDGKIIQRGVREKGEKNDD
jgi:hypothetical protein